jgi:hypothetical protein
MQKGQKIEDKAAESWGQVCWVLGWIRPTASLLLFSIILFLKNFLLFIYSHVLELFGSFLPPPLTSPPLYYSLLLCFFSVIL